VDAYLTGKIIEALTAGDIRGTVAFIAIFIFLWVEVRGLKNAVTSTNKQLTELNSTITKSFADGEKRFEAIEEHAFKIDHRLTVLEKHPRGN